MNSDFDLESYSYELPPHQIAQLPAHRREESRLLVLDCRSNRIQDIKFADIIDFFNPGDLLVINDTKVFPARLEGRKVTGGKVEVFLLAYPDFKNALADEKLTGPSLTGKSRSVDATGLLKSSKKPKPGTRLIFKPDLEAEVMQYHGDGKVGVRLFFDVSSGLCPEEILAASGRVPLPPYVQRTDNRGVLTLGDRQRQALEHARVAAEQNGVRELEQRR